MVHPRVNSAKIPQFMGKPVLVACTVVQRTPDSATVVTSDGGQITVQFNSALPENERPQDKTVVEIIGSVINSSTIKLMKCSRIGAPGATLDNTLFNDVVEMIHDAKYRDIFFPREGDGEAMQFA
ncbi:hypothetical protein DL96DRAFT_1578579 [Flagelloscypha sp. PMI_526]|nr:hypothetical protein DL96DRAFT_1578579 [Flagelloscypha sp. PMI_526]